MSMPFYVSPEQLMKDRADYARKGIARGRSVVAVHFADGVLFVSENPSQALHKVSEIYDRIAFAAVGRYNEFENLRIAGVRLADMRGYAYDRRDVTGRGLANAYAQTLDTIFSSGGDKPYEVEIFVAEIGDEAADDQLYRLTYDGQVADEHGYAVMGGAADVVAGQLAERGAEEPATPAPEDAVAGSGPHQSGHDDPADPTDQVSGAVPPLENPVTGEPPVAPPMSPPVAPPVAPPTRPGPVAPVDPVAPGEPPPPAPQPPVEPPPGPGHPGHPPVDPAEPGDQQP